MDKDENKSSNGKKEVKGGTFLSYVSRQPHGSIHSTPSPQSSIEGNSDAARRGGKNSLLPHCLRQEDPAQERLTQERLTRERLTRERRDAYAARAIDDVHSRMILQETMAAPSSTLSALVKTTVGTAVGAGGEIQKHMPQGPHEYGYRGGAAFPRRAAGAPSHNAELVEAIRNPARSVTVEALIAPQNNQMYCEMFTRPSATRDGQGSRGHQGSAAEVRSLGQGGNAEVLTIADSESRVVKRGHGVMALERVPLAEHGKLAPQEILEKVPSWDPATRRYVCKAEAQTEILLTSLLSDLFEKGHSPHFVVHERSFVCPDKPTHMILERLGTIDSLQGKKKNLASLNDLPRLLEIVGYRASDAPQVMVEVLIAALHTLAMMQRAFLMQSLDVRADNILFRVFLPEDRYRASTAYFRDTSLAPTEITALRYTWQSPSSSSSSSAFSHSSSSSNSNSRKKSREKGEAKFFSLPNRGLIMKMADLGMGGAFGVPLADGTTTTILSVTQDPQSTKEWAALAAAAQSRSNSEKSRKGQTDPSTPLNAVYEREMARRIQSRQTWGYDERFIPGYDAHYLIESMYRLLRRWEKEERFSVSRHHLVYALYDALGLKNPREADRRRPALDHVLQKTPLQLLDILHGVARGRVRLYKEDRTGGGGATAAAAAEANAEVQNQLMPYISNQQNFASKNIFLSRRIDDLVFQSRQPSSSRLDERKSGSKLNNGGKGKSVNRGGDDDDATTLNISLESVLRTPAASSYLV